MAQILLADSTDYLIGGSLTMKNGKIDKYLFEGGYAQASVASSTTDNFAFYYYNQDHLGNIREVVNASGSVQQVTNYYPFGAPYADASGSTNSDFQPYKYNGKELDKMHGLNTYDYGARQHDPILARWDRIDPLCEKYYNVSPYNYCGNNPIILVDPDGKQPTYEEALAMAQHVYGDVNDDVLIGGWQHSTFNIGLQLSNSENGLNSMIYERIVDGNVTEYAYVTAGTTDNQDIIQDMKQLFGVSEQYTQSMENAEILSIQLSDRELTYIGHSLGGGEAGVNLLATAHHNPNKRSAITFNSAGVSDATLNNLGLSRKHENKITSYEMGADIISWGHRATFLPNPLGKREVIPEPGKLPNGASHRVGNIPMKR